LMGQRSCRIHKLIERVQGDFRVIPTRFMLQRYSHLDEIYLAKRAIIDIK
jgi:hypothetical protein